MFAAFLVSLKLPRFRKAEAARATEAFLIEGVEVRVAEEAAIPFDLILEAVDDRELVELTEAREPVDPDLTRDETSELRRVVLLEETLRGRALDRAWLLRRLLLLVRLLLRLRLAPPFVLEVDDDTDARLDAPLPPAAFTEVAKST